MWLRFWDCLSFLISGKQEDKRWSVKHNEDSDITEESTWGQDCHLSATVSWGCHPPMTNSIPGLSVCTAPVASQDPEPSASRTFASWERELWHLPKGLPEGAGGAAWRRGRGCITGKLKTIRETPRNPSTNRGESLSDPQRPIWPHEGPEAAGYQKLGKLMARISAPLCPYRTKVETLEWW